ncbi:hypothetical protein JP75_15530 [Devosia riboflavina]|uniref:Uncharacterized protein n=1 Tax=Devosia riboflavina TaxID=46914 RepID=A0A087M0F2_9HYPH|nr:hypothetical protein [Devosia riboflavina]KFL30355.1 hypothetical protein JP75_15530 [Devosia riboflavina]
MRAWIGLVSVSLACLGIGALAGYAFAQNSERFGRLGKLADAVGGDFLESGSAMAAPPHATTMREGECEAFVGAEPFDRDEIVDGSFILNIDGEQALFSLIACSAGYRPSYYPYLSNEVHGETIKPFPIPMIPRDLVMAADGRWEEQAANAMLALANTAGVYYRADPHQFEAAMSLAGRKLQSVDSEVAQAFAGLYGVAAAFGRVGQGIVCC